MEDRWYTHPIMGLSERVKEHRWSVLRFSICLILSVAVTLSLALFTDMPRQHYYMAGIFTIAALLWISEALPLFATSLLIIGLEIFLLANPGKWAGLGFEGLESPSYKAIIAAAADPVLVLFFGGFMLAHASQKEGVDKKMAAVMLMIFGQRPRNILLGLMVITAFFSMWMSNTATTAMMITLVVPLLDQLPKDDSFRKGLVLSIPFAANIGGMGTPIGSPPNAVAVSLLAKAGMTLGFIEWMAVALPFMAILLVLAWLLLLVFFKEEQPQLKLKMRSHEMDARGWYVILIFGLTIILWLTGKVHGLPSAVVALVPAIAFTAPGILSREDVDRLEWDILLLIAGGISLGAGMTMTGLDKILIGFMPQSGGFVVAAFMMATLALSTFMSNTAAANLILPLGISFAASSALLGVSPVAIAISIALAASSAMALPISTPPNAIAYSQGEIHTKDMAAVGSIIGIAGVSMFILGAEYLITLVGL